ncbi:MAG: 2-octaprenyl-6-methoxyphenyl hydroxylase, partial [Chitinophagaceae bacterium]
MNIDTAQYDIVIVGAGLVGASLACAIAKQESAEKLRIALVEASDETHSYVGQNFDPRVVALTLASQKLLSEIGVWESIVGQRVCAYKDMEVWDGEGTANIHFSASEVRQDYLGHIVENAVIMSALHRKIFTLKNIEIIRPLKVVALQSEEHVTIELSNGLAITTS